jgi:GntR family transcriptional regulator
MPRAGPAQSAAAVAAQSEGKNIFKKKLTSVSYCIICNSTVNLADVNFKIAISTGSNTPIYKQITDQVRLAVAVGRVSVEDQLPSVRVLAEELVVNPNTVARAYADLAREGLIESRAGRGVFITRKRKVFAREEGRRRLEPLLDALVGEALVMDFSQQELREAFEKKLGQWKYSKGGDRSNE